MFGVFGVCVCVCVCCGTLKKRGKNRVWIQKRLRVYIQNVPVCTRTTRTCVTTCRRDAGTHGDVLNAHTGGQGVIASSAYQNLPTYGYHALQKFTKRNPWILPIFSVRTSRKRHVPDSSNHSLYLIKLSSSTYPEGDVGPDGSISLSPSPPHLPPPPPSTTTTTTTTSTTTTHTERDRETERQRDRERRQNPSVTNDLHDLPQWFHVFCYISDKYIYIYIYIFVFMLS